MARQQKPINLLMQAVATVADAQGEAQWRNGYRTGRLAVDRQGFREWEDSEEGRRVHAKEMAAWELLTKKRAAARRLALKLLREAKLSSPSRKSRRKKQVKHD